MSGVGMAGSGTRSNKFKENMSTKNLARVMEKNIAVSGVRFTRTGLVFERVDEATLVEAGLFLQAVDACSAWWWGDFLAAYCGYRLKGDEEENGSAYDEIARGEKLKQYASHYSSICGREAKTLWHWRGVAAFYNSSRRREELSHGHHIEAKDGSDGDSAVADNWLDQSIANGWSVSELRAAIRRSKRQEQEPEEPMPQLVLPMEIIECRRYATATLPRVPAMDAAEAQTLLAELEPVLQFAAALMRHLATNPTATNSVPSNSVPSNSFGRPLATPSLPSGSSLAA